MSYCITLSEFSFTRLTEHQRDRHFRRYRDEAVLGTPSSLESSLGLDPIPLLIPPLIAEYGVVRRPTPISRRTGSGPDITWGAMPRCRRRLTERWASARDVGRGDVGLAAKVNKEQHSYTKSFTTILKLKRAGPSSWLCLLLNSVLAIYIFAYRASGFSALAVRE